MSTQQDIQLKSFNLALSPDDSASLIAGIKAVAGSAATDHFRDILTNILVTIEDNVVKLVATNSYMLTVITLKPWFDLPPGKFEFMVEAKSLVQGMPKAKKNESLQVGYDQEAGTMSFTNQSGGSYIATFREGTFPAWENLTTDRETRATEPVTIGLNPALVANLMKQAHVFRGKTDVPVVIQAPLTEMKPVHMHCNVVDRGEWYGLLMPVRLT